MKKLIFGFGSAFLLFAAQTFAFGHPFYLDSNRHFLPTFVESGVYFADYQNFFPAKFNKIILADVPHSVNKTDEIGIRDIYKSERINFAINPKIFRGEKIVDIDWHFAPSEFECQNFENAAVLSCKVKKEFSAAKVWADVSILGRGGKIRTISSNAIKIFPGSFDYRTYSWPQIWRFRP